MKSTTMRTAFSVIASFAAILLLCGGAIGQKSEVKGAITGRSGATMTVKTTDGGNVTVLLTPATQVTESLGRFHGSENLSVTALVPGLFVQVKGSNNAQNQLVADTVKFSSSDLKAASDAQAGLVPTQQQIEANKQEEQAELAEKQREIDAQQQKLQQQQAEIAAAQKIQAEHTAEIEANKEAIAAANKRFGELDEYNILGDVTILFANNRTVIDEQYKPQLAQLARKAMGIKGYMIQVKGYASKVGGAAHNQRLSLERARNVTNFMEQQGNIPLTNILSAGAMGTSRQVAPSPDETAAEGQADNRRVVVRILQNKGIAGP